MAIKTRNELEKRFKNGVLPTANDFKDLIDSALNRREDRFFGKWEKASRYCNGDMVLYCDSLYILRIDDSNGDTQEQEDDSGQTGTENAPRSCICSITEPSNDARWKPLTVRVQDDDWVVTDIDGNTIMYANETVKKVGIGTTKPEAKLDIHVEGKGAFRFSPTGDDDKDEAVFSIRTGPDPKNRTEVKQSVGQDNAWWHTDASGYAFMINAQTTANQDEPAGEVSPDDPNLKVRITTHAGKPAVGIGTGRPEAALHAKDEASGEIKLQSSNQEGPYMYIANLAGEHKNYFFATVQDEATVIRTKEGSSIYFRHVEAEDDKNPCNDESPAVAISPAGKVGIGTERPASHLDVVDKEDKKGRFRLSFEEKNPALAVINTRPREETNYFTIGVDNNRAALVTDSPHGFEFKTGSPCINNNNEVNINQDGGETLLSIYPDAKVGVGKHPDGAYALDVNGPMIASGIYLPADSREMKDAEPLDGSQMLAKLKKLVPIEFNWKGKEYPSTPGLRHEIGLRAKDVDEEIPQVVLSHRNQPESIAYQNLVAVLIAAINHLAQRVEELEGGGGSGGPGGGQRKY